MQEEKLPSVAQKSHSLPESVTQKHFYMWCFETRVMKKSIKHPLKKGFVRFIKYNADMSQNQNRYKDKNIFFKIENITSNLQIHSQAIIPFLKEKLGYANIETYDRYVDVKEELVEQAKIYLTEFFDWYE